MFTDYACQENREEEVLPVLKHQYHDSKLHRKEQITGTKTILVTRGSTERKQPDNKNGKKTTACTF